MRAVSGSISCNDLLSSSASLGTRTSESLTQLGHEQLAIDETSVHSSSFSGATARAARASDGRDLTASVYDFGRRLVLLVPDARLIELERREDFGVDGDGWRVYKCKSTEPRVQDGQSHCTDWQAQVRLYPSHPQPLGTLHFVHRVGGDELLISYSLSPPRRKRCVHRPAGRTYLTSEMWKQNNMFHVIE